MVLQRVCGFPIAIKKIFLKIFISSGVCTLGSKFLIKVLNKKKTHTKIEMQKKVRKIQQKWFEDISTYISYISDISYISSIDTHTQLGKQVRKSP